MWRSGRLVRVDRDGTLPDRCAACNALAGGYRLKRKLHYSPVAWKIGASLTPFLALLAAVWLDLRYLAMAFWPLVIILVIANFFVRKSVRIEIGACKRHQDLRFTLMTLSWVLVGAVILFTFLPGDGWLAILMLLSSIVGVAVLVTLQSYVGVQAVRVSSIDARHVWLSGTGESFRAALPELN